MGIICGVIAFMLLGPCLHLMLTAWYESDGLEAAWWLLMLLLNLNTIRLAIQMFYEEYDDGREDEEDSAGR